MPTYARSITLTVATALLAATTSLSTAGAEEAATRTAEACDYCSSFIEGDIITQQIVTSYAPVTGYEATPVTPNALALSAPTRNPMGACEPTSTCPMTPPKF